MEAFSEWPSSSWDADREAGTSSSCKLPSELPASAISPSTPAQSTASPPFCITQETPQKIPTAISETKTLLFENKTRERESTSWRACWVHRRWPWRHGGGKDPPWDPWAGSAALPSNSDAAHGPWFSLWHFHKQKWDNTEIRSKTKTWFSKT